MCCCCCWCSSWRSHHSHNQWRHHYNWWRHHPTTDDVIITPKPPDRPTPHYDYKLLSLEKMATNSFHVPLYSHPRLVPVEPSESLSRAPVYRELEQMTIQTNSMNKYEQLFWVAVTWLSRVGHVTEKLNCRSTLSCVHQFLSDSHVMRRREIREKCVPHRRSLSLSLSVMHE